MGKWTHLRDVYDALPDELKFADESPDYILKLQAAKDELRALTLPELAEAYNARRAAKEAHAAAGKPLSLQLEAAKLLLCERLDDAEMSSFKLTNGQNFIRTDEPKITVKDKRANREWFQTHGMEDLLSVHTSTQAALVKGILEDPLDPNTGQPKTLPDGIDIYMDATLQRRNK